MLKQSSSRIKKTLASLLVVFFVVSVTAAVVSTEPVVVKAAKGFVVDTEDGQMITAKEVASDTK
jgi:hypothetical protein